MRIEEAIKLSKFNKAWIPHPIRGQVIIALSSCISDCYVAWADTLGYKGPADNYLERYTRGRDNWEPV